MSVIPYGRMQFIDVTAGRSSAAFGLATVRMHTAAAASRRAHPGLSARRPRDYADRLAGSSVKRRRPGCDAS